MLQSVTRQARRPGDVEETLAGVDLARELDRGFVRRVEIRHGDRALVHVDLRDLASQEDDAGGLRAGDAADEQDPAVLLLEALDAPPCPPWQPQGAHPAQAEKQDELEFRVHDVV